MSSMYITVCACISVNRDFRHANAAAQDRAVRTHRRHTVELHVPTYMVRPLDKNVGSQVLYMVLLLFVYASSL